MRRLPLLGLALTLLLTGCSTVAEHKQPAESASPDAVPAPPVAVTRAPGPDAPVWGEQNYVTVYTDDSQPGPIFSPEYRLPLIENTDASPAYPLINEFYTNALDDLAASSAETFAWALEDARNAKELGFPFQPFVDEETYQLTLETPTRVSILRSHYSNSGGPHPLLYPIGDTFDLTTGKRLTFADLFTVPADQAAARVLEAVLASNAAGSYGGTPLPEEDLKVGWSPERFYLTEDAIVIYFPDSELPHPVGTPTFAVPYTQLEDILQTWE